MLLMLWILRVEQGEEDRIDEDDIGYVGRRVGESEIALEDDMVFDYEWVGIWMSSFDFSSLVRSGTLC